MWKSVQQTYIRAPEACQETQTGAVEKIPPLGAGISSLHAGLPVSAGDFHLDKFSPSG
jgi:hypothetical protein